MRILIAVLCMAMIGTVAVVLAAVQALITLAPLLIAALIVVGAVRFWERRGRAPVSAQPAPTHPAAIPRPLPAAPRVLPRPGGWVLVPVWMDSNGRPQRHPVIDAEVISEADHHG